MLSFELRQIAGMAAGTYFVVSDNSPQQNIETFSNLRAVPIVSEYGATNQLLIFQQGDTAGFKNIFGKVSRKQERLGNYSISSCLEMLKSGPLAVINLRNYSDDDKINISTENIDLKIANPQEQIPYSQIVYENGFWVVKPSRLNDINTENLLSFTNVNSSDVTYFVVKADAIDTEGLTNEGLETLAEMEVKVDDFPALKPETIFNDTFVSVYIFKNNFNDSATNPNYGKYFVNGNISVENLKLLAKNKYSGFSDKVTGTLIPFVKSEFGNDISIDIRLNKISAKTGLYSMINPEVFEIENDSDIFSNETLIQNYLSKLSYNSVDKKLVYGVGLDATNKLKSLSYEFNPAILGGEKTSTGVITSSAGVGLINYSKDYMLAAAHVDNDINVVSLLGKADNYQTKFDVTDLSIDFDTLKTTSSFKTIMGTPLYNKFLTNPELYLGYGVKEKYDKLSFIQKMKYVELSKTKVKVSEVQVTDFATPATMLTNLFNKAKTYVTSNALNDFNLTGPENLFFLPQVELEAEIDPATPTQTKFNYLELDKFFKDNNKKVRAEYSIKSTFSDNTTATKLVSVNFNENYQVDENSERLVFFKNGDAAIPATKVEISIEIKGYYTTNLQSGKVVIDYSSGNPVVTSEATNINDVVAQVVNQIDYTVVDFKFDLIAEDELNVKALNEINSIKSNPSDLVSLKLISTNKFADDIVVGTTLQGLKLRDSQKYNGSPDRQNELLDVLINPSIINGFKNSRNIRYFVDVFKTNIESNYKYQFNELVYTLDKCNIFVRAFVNEPFIRDLIKSVNPSFKDAVGDTRTLKLDKYLETGGNELTSNKFLTKPAKGAEMVYYFGSGEEVNGYNVNPITPVISNAFIAKNKIWDIVANSTGVLSGVDNIELNPDEPTRRVMERFGWNPIIKKKKDIVIYGDFTGLQAFKKRKALSFISNSELLMYIKNELYNMSLDENFKKGRYEDYIKFETEVNNFMSDLALQQAIQPNPEVVCNFTNNTTDVQRVGIKLCKISYVNFRTLDKVVFQLELE